MNPKQTRLPLALLVFLMLVPARGTPVITLQPAANLGFDVYADGVLVAPIRLAANGAIVADVVTTNSSGIRLTSLRARDSQAVVFAADDFVSITLPAANPTNPPVVWEPTVQFKLTIQSFNTNKWLALFPGGPAPFHFLVCSMPTAKVWHQIGWLNATPVADPFPLLQDVHDGSPELSCLWNRNWSYICPLGGHPIPMIGLWDPAASLYVGYDFQGARATDDSERFLATAYCWQQGTSPTSSRSPTPTAASASASRCIRRAEKCSPRGSTSKLTTNCRIRRTPTSGSRSACSRATPIRCPPCRP